MTYRNRARNTLASMLAVVAMTSLLLIICIKITAQIYLNTTPDQ